MGCRLQSPWVRPLTDCLRVQLPVRFGRSGHDPLHPRGDSGCTFDQAVLGRVGGVADPREGTGVGAGVNPPPFAGAVAALYSVWARGHTARPAAALGRCLPEDWPGLGAPAPRDSAPACLAMGRPRSGRRRGCRQRSPRRARRAGTKDSHALTPGCSDAAAWVGALAAWARCSSKVCSAHSRQQPQRVATPVSSCSSSKLMQPARAWAAMWRSLMPWQMQTIMAHINAKDSH